MFNSAFDAVGARPGDYYPKELREEIDALNARIYDTVNNGVYKAGFATTQAAYEEAVTPLFETLDWLEERLAQSRFLCDDVADRGGHPAVHHAGALRCGLSRPLQVQHPPADRLPRTSGPIRATSTRSQASRATVNFGAHQAALLPEPQADQSDRHRSGRTAARL